MRGVYIIPHNGQHRDSSDITYAKRVRFQALHHLYQLSATGHRQIGEIKKRKRGVIDRTWTCSDQMATMYQIIEFASYLRWLKQKRAVALHKSPLPIEQ